MGIFDAFKKKVEEKSEEINPIFGVLQNAELGIEDLQVANNAGTIRVSGNVQNGEVLSRVEEIVLAQPGANAIDNAIEIADVSAQNIHLEVETRSSNLNVRQGPGTNHDIVGKFPKGTKVTLVKRINNTWYVVRGNDIEGHCHTDYLKEI